jgi:hypothetical protein
MVRNKTFFAAAALTAGGLVRLDLGDYIEV